MYQKVAMNGYNLENGLFYNQIYENIINCNKFKNYKN